MQICIQDLRDYTEGLLRYKWVDMKEVTDLDELQEIVFNYLDERTKKTGELHEEWFIADYEDFPNLGEYPGLEAVIEVAEVVKNYDCRTVKAFIEYEGVEYLENFEEKYRGIFESEKDFAYEDIQSHYDLEKMMGNLSIYFDYESYAHDLFINDFYSVKIAPCEIVVFSRY
jgi:antirestriction protein